MQDVHEIQCVECGAFFSVEDADIVSTISSAIRCPECGRCNYCPEIEDNSLTVESFEADDGLDDTDEIYMENYLSSDLEYDGENKLDAPTQKRIGVAKRKRSISAQPMFEYRKIIAQNMPLEYGKKGYHTHTDLDDLLEYENRSPEDAEQ